MSVRCRAIAVCWLLMPAVVCAQEIVQERPAILLQPLSQMEWNQRESLKQYVLGLLYEHADKIFDALQAYQEAARLDPEAPAVWKVQAPLLASLEKSAEAIAACKKALDLDPGDFEVWYMQARLHKLQAESKESQECLERALKTERLKDHPEMAQQIHYELGGLLESAKEYRRAAAAFVESAKILDHPDHIAEQAHVNRAAVLQRAGEVYERIGHLYRQSGEPKKASEAYQLAQVRHPALASRISFHLAQMLRDQGEHEQALHHLDGYLRFQPSSVEPYEMRLDLLHKMKRGDQALPWLDRAAQNDPHNTGLKLLLAQQYAKARQAERAEKIYLGLAETGPAPEVYRGLFDLMRDKPLGATEILETVNRVVEQATDKENPRPNLAATQGRAMLAVIREDADLAKQLVTLGLERIQLGRDDLKFETVHFLAHLAEKNRRLEDSERFYRSCRKKPSNEALIYSGLLRVLWKQSKYDDIVEVCREGSKTSQATNRLLFFNEEAKALARLERYNEALKLANQVLEAAGDNERVGVRHLRVRLLTQAERFQEAETEALTLLKEHQQPGEVMDIHYLLSHVYSSSKQYAKAEEQLEKILRIDPSNATANNDLGYFWADQGKNLKEAEELIRRAIEQDRKQRKTNPNMTAEDDVDNAAYVDSLGWVLFRLGRFDEARQELERAAALPEGNDPTMWDHLGDVYLRMGRTDQARNAYRRALHFYEQERRRKMDDRYRDVQRKLKMLDE